MATVKFRLRRDTAANWTATNPVLALGEPGHETDTRKTKYGDGVTAWNALAYSVAGAVAWTGITGKPTTLAGYGITDGQALDSDLTALAGNATNGLWARTGAGTGAARTITGAANEITVTNGDGVSGNPTLSLPTALTFTGKTITGGTMTLAVTISATGRIASGGTIYAVADASIPTNSVGLELGWLGATSRILSFSRAASTYQPLQFSGSAIVLNIAATDIVTVGATGATVTGSVAATTWLKSGSYTVATVPSASTAGAGSRIYVSNESGGAVTAFSDGTNWRRSTDRAVIS